MRLVIKDFLTRLSWMLNYPFVLPDFVQVNFTFDCNLRCKMCSMHEQRMISIKSGKQVDIDSETLKKIILEAYAWRIKNILFIGGEPFLRKDLFDLIDFTARLDLNPIIVTNGVLLDETTIKKCLESNVGWLSISIDGATEKTFSKIRGENIFPVIIKNVALVNRLKNESQKNHPRLIAVCTVMDENLEELLDIVALAKSIGMEKIFFQPVVADNTDQTQRRPGAPGFVAPERFALLDEAIDKLLAHKKGSEENFDFIANSCEKLALIKKYFRGTLKPEESLCYAGYNRFQVIQEGKAYFCVNQQKFEATFGDIAKDRLKKLWYSPRAHFYRKLIKKCPVPCLQGCSYSDDLVRLTEITEKRKLRPAWEGKTGRPLS